MCLSATALCFNSEQGGAVKWKLRVAAPVGSCPRCKRRKRECSIARCMQAGAGAWSIEMVELHRQMKRIGEIEMKEMERTRETKVVKMGL